MESALTPSSVMDPSPDSAPSTDESFLTNLEGLELFPTNVMVQGVQCKMPPFLPIMGTKGGQRQRDLWKVKVKALELGFIKAALQVVDVPLSVLLLLFCVTVLLKGLNEKWMV